MSTVVNDPVADIVADAVATTRRGSLMYSRNRFHAPRATGSAPGQYGKLPHT